MRPRCECRQYYCCDLCWKRPAKDDPCQALGCENPAGHVGEHGPLRNTQTIRITAEELLSAIKGER